MNDHDQQKYQALIIRGLRVDLDDESANVRICVAHLTERVTTELSHDVQHHGLRTACLNWLQGLGMPIPYSNWDLYRWAHWALVDGAETDPMMASDDEICGYAMESWQRLATAAHDLITWGREYTAEETAEVDPEDYTDQYDNMLNEPGNIEVMGSSYEPAHLLKTLDPTDYRQGLLNYVDGLDTDPDLSEFEGLRDALDELADEVDEYLQQQDDD